MNILDYLDWRGDLSLTERPFNEVDNLILSTLIYLDMDKLVPDGFRATISLPELLDLYLSAGYDQSRYPNNPLPLLSKAAKTERFAPVRVGGYINTVNQSQQIQFAAATFFLPDNTAYIAFRGTDDSITGWREDCNFSLSAVTPGQTEAASYVSAACDSLPGLFRIGGHSKGGNFAVYASSFCSPAAKERILTVYSNDGPGFNQGFLNSEEYVSVLPKIQKIIPESSMVGILLSGKEPVRVIKSSARGIYQHNPYSWQIIGSAFAPAEARSDTSVFWEETLKKWVDTLSDEQKANMITAIFDEIEANGITTMSELTSHPMETYALIRSAVMKADPEKQGELLESFKKLFSAGREVIGGKFQSQISQLFSVPEKSKDSEPDQLSKNRYYLLRNYLRVNGSPSITLTFEEIEQITGFPVDASIALEWLTDSSNEYRIGRFFFAERTIRFLKKDQ